MSDSWRDIDPQSTRTSRSVESMSRGTLHGRVAQAAPVRRVRTEPDPKLEIYVQDYQPDGAMHLAIWFDTSESGGGS